MFLVIGYSLWADSYAPNSERRLYLDAQKVILESHALDRYLLPPVIFTHSPNTTQTARGLPPIPHRLVRHPKSGRTHLIMTFWAHGRGKDEPEPYSWLKQSYAQVLTWGREAGEWAGIPLPSEKPLESPEPEKEDEQPPSGRWSVGSWFGGLGVSSLRQPLTSPSSPTIRGVPPAGTFKLGEVQGDWVMGSDGEYALVALVIDVPSSGSSRPFRAVAHWSPDAEYESLIGGRHR